MSDAKLNQYKKQISDAAENLMSSRILGTSSHGNIKRKDTGD